MTVNGVNGSVEWQCRPGLDLAAEAAGRRAGAGGVPNLPRGVDARIISNSHFAIQLTLCHISEQIQKLC